VVNPLSVDADGDTLSDALGASRLQPGREIEPQRADPGLPAQRADAWGETTASDGMVLPGQTLYYTAKVTNRLLSREAEGLLPPRQPPASAPGRPGRSFVLRPQEQSETSGQLSVSADAAGGVHDVTQVAGATISDWAGTAGGMLLWLPFNDPNAPWFDRSGNQPPHDGACFDGQGQTPWRGCTLDANGAYGNGLKLDGYSFVESAAQPPQAGGAVSCGSRPPARATTSFAPIPTGRIRFGSSLTVAS
jgi:hypothetical protein